ncbi:peptidoglycan-associated lipoprotein [Hydrocarboniphaga daqingensis]|uniref:Peptidoglycan-associated lipoprotein n=1 Tax=Hydrocarboniphaga daqingensis TaxID=490188 RepID=A0A1M5RTQ8_9GAMM|nr:peptidoglycan-associated lipoprotein Pal [Hydrocarboniphaga daqingensis]SHH29616.1 peptidoglycan-associated lipoprotein [Hydrocarboniphaga daqingensis]
MFKQILVTSVVAAALTVSGCASKGKKAAPLPPPTNNSGMSNYGASDSSVTGTGLGAGGITAADLANKKTVYFQFDSSDLTSEGRAVAAAWASYLSANPSVRVRLEGNADERGTREYNVGLGEHRANAVQAALTSGGASASQISVVSYGEERPVAAGHDEAAYSLNRRVDIVQQ